MTNLPQQIMQKCEQGIGTTTYRTTTPQQSSQERAEEHVRLRRVGGVCIGRRTCRRPTGRTGRNRDAQLQTYVPEQTCRLDMFDTGRGCSLLSETTDVGRSHDSRGWSTRGRTFTTATSHDIICSDYVHCRTNVTATAHWCENLGCSVVDST
jgi:hypothetical protein